MDVRKPVPVPGSAVSNAQANGAVVGPASTTRGGTPGRVQADASVARIANRCPAREPRRFSMSLGAIGDAKLAGQMKIRSERNVFGSRPTGRLRRVEQKAHPHRTRLESTAVL